MKIEKREVVITKEVFVAVDGKEFDDRYDCIEHEYLIHAAKLACYNRKFEKTTFEHCLYVRLDTEEDVKLVLSLCEYQGISRKGFDNPGVYIYAYDQGDCWVNMTEAIKRICGGADNAEN